MKFTDAALDEFAAIWEDEFDEPLTRDEAEIHASLFMELCKLLVQPLPAEPDYQGAPLIIL